LPKNGEQWITPIARLPQKRVARFPVAEKGNNLHNIALAQHNYHDTFKTFPSGQIFREENGAWMPGWSWAAQSLPFIEQSTISDQLDYSLEMNTPNNRNLIAVPIEVFSCPSSTKDDTKTKSNVTWATSSYVGCSGAFNASMRTPNQLNSNWSTDKVLNGMFARNSRVTMSKITDGTSNTIMIGEIKWYAFTWDGLWAGSAKNRGGYFGADSTLASLRSARRKINVPDTANNVARREGFHSEHPGGAQFALADGSATFVSETINHNNCYAGQWNNGNKTLGVWQRACARNDGLVYTFE
jgi:prepilin-type processing-associated H-X9-DG protein